MRRPGFFFAFEEKLDVESRRRSLRVQSIEGGEYSHDAGLVVRRAARIEAPLGIDLAAGWQRDHLSAFIGPIRSPRRLKRRRSGPGFHVHRLSVVMRVKDD